MDDDEILARITEVIRDTLKGAQSVPIVSRKTTAYDVPGWDSFSHGVLMLNIESEFGVELPVRKTLGLNNVGDIIDLIRQAQQNS
jgi:acyl carrier protein